MREAYLIHVYFFGHFFSFIFFLIILLQSAGIHYLLFKINIYINDIFLIRLQSKIKDQK